MYCYHKTGYAAWWQNGNCNLELEKTFELFKPGLMGHKCGNVEDSVAKNNIDYERLAQKASV